MMSQVAPGTNLPKKKEEVSSSSSVASSSTTHHESPRDTSHDSRTHVTTTTHLDRPSSMNSLLTNPRRRPCQVAFANEQRLLLLLCVLYRPVVDINNLPWPCRDRAGGKNLHAARRRAARQLQHAAAAQLLNSHRVCPETQLAGCQTLIFCSGTGADICIARSDVVTLKFGPQTPLPSYHLGFNSSICT
jgi:hypothetical protein